MDYLILHLKWLNTNVRFYEALDRWQTNCHYQKWETGSGSLSFQRTSASDVALKLRGQGIFQLKDVKRAVIEQNGQMIVVRAGDEKPKYPIITDGVVQLENFGNNWKKRRVVAG